MRHSPPLHGADHRRRRMSVRRRGVLLSTVFVVCVFVVPFAILTIGANWAMHRIAAEEAERDVLASTLDSTHATFAPLLTDRLLDGDPDASTQFDAAARSFVAANHLLRFKVWSGDGHIVYSDEPRLVGKRFPLSRDENALLGRETGTSDVTDFSKAENRLDSGGQAGRALEVYVGALTGSGRPLLVEGYFPYSVLEHRAADLRSAFLPPMLAALAALTLIQVPIAVLLARRVARYRADRERLLQRALDVSDIERRRIAREVHDGAVQDLIAIAYRVEGVAARAEPPTDATLRDAAVGTRRTIRSLRSMLSSIYPVELPEGGIDEGLADLVAVLRERGVAVDVDLPPQRFSPVDETLVLRVAREALRNVYAHAHASHVLVRLQTRMGRLRLEIKDDGTGFTDAQARAQRRAGHLGLELLADLAVEVGAQLDVTSETGVGTAVRLEMAST